MEPNRKTTQTQQAQMSSTNSMASRTSVPTNNTPTPTQIPESSATRVMTPQLAKRTVPPSRNPHVSGSTPVQDSNSTSNESPVPLEPQRKSTRVGKRVYSSNEWLIDESGGGETPQQRQMVKNLREVGGPVELIYEDDMLRRDGSDVVTSTEEDYQRRVDSGHSVDKILGQRVSSDGKVEYLVSWKRLVLVPVTRGDDGGVAKRRRSEESPQSTTTTNPTLVSSLKNFGSQFDQFINQLESDNEKKNEALNESQSITNETKEKLRNLETEKFQEKLAVSEAGRKSAEADKQRMIRNGNCVLRKMAEEKKLLEEMAEGYKKERDEAVDKALIDKLKFKEALKRMMDSV